MTTAVMDKTVTRYNHLYLREYNNVVRKVMTEAVPLHDWLYVTITTENDSKYVTVFSKHHVNKALTLPTGYSMEYSDTDILLDQSDNIHSLYGDCSYRSWDDSYESSCLC